YQSLPIIPRKLIACQAGGFALLADQNDRTLVIRLDESATTQWVHDIPLDQRAEGGSLTENPGGELVLLFTHASQYQVPRRMEARKLSATGKTLWKKTWHGFEELPALV